jgi:hypothetical protein
MKTTPTRTPVDVESNAVLTALQPALGKGAPPFVRVGDYWYSSKHAATALKGLVVDSADVRDGHRTKEWFDYGRLSMHRSPESNVVVITGRRPASIPGRFIQCRYQLNPYTTESVSSRLESHAKRAGKQSMKKSLGVRTISRNHLTDIIEIAMCEGGPRQVPCKIKDGLAIHPRVPLHGDDLDWSIYCISHVASGLSVLHDGCSLTDTWTILHRLLQVTDWTVERPDQGPNKQAVIKLIKQIRSEYQ